jgi:hypothetical protein
MGIWEARLVGCGVGGVIGEAGLLRGISVAARTGAMIAVRSASAKA